MDVDGVVCPVGGRTAWGDDIVTGNVFGPVYTSPALCARLDALAERPDVTGWWLTSWPESMRSSLTLLPGRGWLTINPETVDEAHPDRWWKLEALRLWLDAHCEVTSIAWCDDHLNPERAEAVRRWLGQRGIPSLLVSPPTATGLTPRHLDALQAWAEPDFRR